MDIEVGQSPTLGRSRRETIPQVLPSSSLKASLLVGLRGSDLQIIYKSAPPPSSALKRDAACLLTRSHGDVNLIDTHTHTPTR